ncbi:MAG: Holliday junction branch migration protein RuvA [Verrucomicrobiota bacterium]
MITFLRGTLVHSLANQITIDVNGVGYELFVPLASIDSIGKPGDQVRVLTHLHIRENENTLYGFASDEERDLFRLLLNRVSGVGPKLAMAVLSGMSPDQFKVAVIENDIASLSKISGLGKKTAERIVLELKDKVGITAAWESASQDSGAASHANDAVLALISLGYKQADAQKAVKKAIDSPDISPDSPSDDIIRTALRSLN